MRCVEDVMIVQIEERKGIRDQLCVARQSRTFDQRTVHEAETTLSTSLCSEKVSNMNSRILGTLFCFTATR
jgi:hypothetical protein